MTRSTSRPACQSRLAAAGLAPIGLDREQAAAYVGLSPSHFTALVEEGVMPRPKRIGTRLVWPVRALAEAFDRLPADGPPQPAAEENDVWGRTRV